MKIFLLILVLTLAGCMPRPMAQRSEAPEGASPLYRKAWKDGCNAGMLSMSNSLYNFMYGWKDNEEIDAQYINNKEYNYVWWRAFKYCRHGTRGWTMQ